MSNVLEVKTIVETQQAEKAVEGLDSGIKETADSTEGLTDSLDKMTGGAISGFKKMVGGIKKGVLGMKTLKGAIAATGIGALLIAITSLTSYFTKTQRGADFLNKAMAGIGATVDVLIDRFSTFGEGVFKILTGDFSEGLDILKGSFAGVGEEIANETKAALDLEKAFQVLEKRKINFIVTEAQLLSKISAARAEAEDVENFNAKERNAANERAIALTKELANEKIAQTTEELRILTARNALGESMNEDLEAQRTLEAELFNIETTRDNTLKSLLAKQKTITGELGKQKVIVKEVDEFEAGKIESAGFATLTPEQDIKLAQQDLFLDEMAKKNKAASDYELSQQEERNQRSIDLEAQKKEAKIGLIGQAFAIISQLGIKNEKYQRKLAAGEALFNTYLAINKTLAAFAGVPVPGYAIAQAIGTGAFGLLQANKILKGSSGAGAAPSFSGGGSAQGNNRNESRVPDFSFTNQGVGGTQNAGFANRSYVLQSDIESQAALNNAIQDRARVD